MQLIRPVEFSGMIQRTQDVSTIKQNEDVKPQFEHAIVQQRTQKEAISKHESVIKKDNADKNQKKFDAKEKGSNEYFSNNNKRERNNSNNDGAVIKKEQGTFDVSV